MRRFWSWTFRLLLTTGIILPVWMIAFEFMTHQISGTLFDPMPTPWHGFLLVLIPLSLGLKWGARRPVSMLVADGLLSLVFPMLMLQVVAIGADHWTAVLKLIFGMAAVFLGGRDALFCDYSLSPIAALAVLAPLMACASGLLLVATSQTSWRILFLGFVVGLLVTGSMEHSRWSLYQDLRRSLATGDVPGIDNKAGREVVARLSHLPQQFSSAGSLYAVGPVDLFGALTKLRVNWEHPCGAMQKLVGDGMALRHVREQLETRAGHKLVPSSWRGLSPWELWIIQNDPSGR